MPASQYITSVPFLKLEMDQQGFYQLWKYRSTKNVIGKNVPLEMAEVKMANMQN